jgi:hypothetical protein
MDSDNIQKKQEIDVILAKKGAQMNVLKQKRDKIISEFNEALKEKKLAELKNSLMQKQI